MKLVEINSVEFGSTGKIARQITDLANKNGIDAYFAYAKSRRTSKIFGGKKQNEKDILIGSIAGKIMHEILARLTGLELHFSFFATKRFVHNLKKIKPDIVHLHNIHGWYLNVPILFKYFKKNNIKVVWTLHDCWSFTGHCPHFELAKCNKWKTSCFNCPLYKNYPYSIFDNSRKMHNFKKKWFTYLDSVVLVTPSKWLANLIHESFLNKYPVRIINNGIDLTIFKKTNSNFRKKYNISNDIILLGGVAMPWSTKKGLDYFIKLANVLPNNYQIILVGTDEKVDKILPKNVISIHKTNNQSELAEAYTAFDIYINPTLEDNFPTVNIESIACNTPVITFNTGGSPECIDDNSGIVVPKGNFDKLLNAIIKFDFKKYRKCNLSSKKFNKDDKFLEYINLFKEL